MKRHLCIMALALVALAAPGFAQYYAGPTVVSSSGLGYESPYGGLTISAEKPDGVWMIGAEVPMLQAKKLDTGTGNAVSGELRILRVIGRYVALGASVKHAQQFAGLYEKGATTFGPELTFLGKKREFRASFGAKGGDTQIEQVLYVRLERVNHHRFGFTFEEVRFMQGDAHMDGSRIAFHYGFRLGRLR